MQQQKPARFLSDEELVELVHAIESRAQGAEARLYSAMRNAFSYYLVREVGQDWEDQLHDAFLLVVDAIQRRQVDRPQAILGFAKTIIYRAICKHFRSGESDPFPSAEEKAEQPHLSCIEHDIDYQRKVAIMMAALNQLSERDQELLRRFYLLEQPEAHIRREMKLTATQFRLFKSGAKSRLSLKGAALNRPSLRRESAKAKTAS